MSEPVFVVEVGPRDGLQNTKTLFKFEQKKKLIQSLLEAGFEDVEAGSFVRPDQVPALADTGDIASHFEKANNNLWYLAPNLVGLKKALEKKITQIAIFTAASPTFNEKNIGMSLEKNFSVIQDMITYLKDEGFNFVPSWTQKPQTPKAIKLRLYISTVIACPYDGALEPQRVFDLSEKYRPMGFSQVSLGDTTGVGTPQSWENLLKLFSQERIQNLEVAMHCHDTHNRALDCIRQGLDQGIRTFDSSIGGLGGCPFAPGAPGNLATEKLIPFLENQGFTPPVTSASLKKIELKDILPF